MGAVDTEARRGIALLRARIAELEGRPAAPFSLPAGERFAAVLTAACAEFGATREEALGQTRVPRAVLARHAAMALGQRCLGYSLPRIGRLMGRDHTTVLHGIRRIAALAEADPDFAARMDRAAESIRNRGSRT